MGPGGRPSKIDGRERRVGAGGSRGSIIMFLCSAGRKLSWRLGAVRTSLRQQTSCWPGRCGRITGPIPYRRVVVATEVRLRSRNPHVANRMKLTPGGRAETVRKAQIP